MSRLVSRLVRTNARAATFTSFGPGLSLTSLRPATAPLTRTWTGVRCLHNRLELPYPVDNGMGDFLSPSALRMIAEEYQQGLLDRLNEEVRGTPLQNKTVVQTVINAAQEPDLVLAFNYASEALNNSFFLQSLRPPAEGESNNEKDISDSLKMKFRTHFETFEQFKSFFSASVLGMFGNGWVWLVLDGAGQLAVVPTFGTGTLLSLGRKQRLVVGEEEPSARAAREAAQAVAASTQGRGVGAGLSSPTSGMSRRPAPLNPATTTRTMSTENINLQANSLVGVAADKAETVMDPRSSTTLMKEVGENLYPLLCVSVHEHAWVGGGYGIWGKEEYIRRFWSVVNWAQVSDLCKDRYNPADTL